MLTLAIVFMVGASVGACLATGVVGALAARSYERGRADERAEDQRVAEDCCMACERGRVTQESMRQRLREMGVGT